MRTALLSESVWQRSFRHSKPSFFPHVSFCFVLFFNPYVLFLSNPRNEISLSPLSLTPEPCQYLWPSLLLSEATFSISLQSQCSGGLPWVRHWGFLEFPPHSAMSKGHLDFAPFTHLSSAPRISILQDEYMVIQTIMMEGTIMSLLASLIWPCKNLVII